MPNNYIKKTKKNIENFKKQYLSKNFLPKVNQINLYLVEKSKKTTGNDFKTYKAKKNLVKKKKLTIPSLQKVVSRQNVKMRTIDLGESRNKADISESSSSSFVFSIRDNNNDYNLKKSSTVGDLLEPKKTIT